MLKTRGAVSIQKCEDEGRMTNKSKETYFLFYNEVITPAVKTD